MNDAPLPPPLDDFLHAPPPAVASEALRRELLAKTTRLVRRGRAVRRLAVAWLAAASVIATLVGWSLWRPAPEPERRVVIVDPSGSMNLAPDPAPDPPTPTPEPMPPALAKEWQAFDTRGPERVQLLMEAGDRYIADHHDLASAVRCYRQALDAAPHDVLAINPNDNWLVMAMKLDRQKEN